MKSNWNVNFNLSAITRQIVHWPELKPIIKNLLSNIHALLSNHRNSLSNVQITVIDIC